MSEFKKGNVMKKFLVIVFCLACSSSSVAPLVVGEVRCNDDSDCSGGQICQDGFCRIFCNEETGSEPCWESGKVCSTELEYCVDCTQSSHCTEAHRCNNFSCEFFCLEDSHCETEEFCNAGDCLEKQCENSSDCNGGEICNRFVCERVRTDAGVSFLDSGVQFLDSSISESDSGPEDSSVLIADVGVDSFVTDSSASDAGIISHRKFLETSRTHVEPEFALMVSGAQFSTNVEYGGMYRIDLADITTTDPGANLYGVCAEGHRCFSIQIYRENIECAIGNGGGFERVQVRITDDLIGWHQIDCKIQDGVGSISIDGIERRRQPVGFVPPPNNTPMYFAYVSFEGAVESFYLKSRDVEIFNFNFEDFECFSGRCFMDNSRGIQLSWAESHYTRIEE